ncbi:MAG: transposase, family [Actinomycetia bacterium]|nr:transposase, family [Actinomycetes bacterium]
MPWAFTRDRTRTPWSGSSGSWARSRSRTTPGRTWHYTRCPAPSRSRWPGRPRCPRWPSTARPCAAPPPGDGKIPYLLAAATHGTGAVLAKRLIGPKTNEVPEFGPLLLELNQYYPLAGHVITADAGHTVKAHATLICEKLLAHYVLTVKLNTPRLWAELDALDWAKIPRLATEERGHGRWERRTIQVMDAPAHIRGRFPHARQVALVERYVTRIIRVKKGKRWARKVIRSAVAVLIITSLDAREASPAHLAGYVRGHWTIENKVHWAAMSHSARIPPGSGPDPGPASWPHSVFSPSASSPGRLQQDRRHHPQNQVRHRRRQPLVGSRPRGPERSDFQAHQGSPVTPGRHRSRPAWSLRNGQAGNRRRGPRPRD